MKITLGSGECRKPGNTKAIDLICSLALNTGEDESGIGFNLGIFLCASLPHTLLNVKFQRALGWEEHYSQSSFVDNLHECMRTSDGYQLS